MKELRHTTTIIVPDDMFASAELLTKVKPIVEKCASDLKESIGEQHVKHSVDIVTPKKKAPAPVPVAPKKAA